jgi:hypothetical protein
MARLLGAVWVGEQPWGQSIVSCYLAVRASTGDIWKAILPGACAPSPLEAP